MVYAPAEGTMFLSADISRNRLGARLQSGESERYLHCLKNFTTKTTNQTEKVKLFFCLSEKLLNIENRPYRHSEKETESNDTWLNFVEFSNVHNSDRTSNAT